MISDGSYPAHDLAHTDGKLVFLSCNYQSFLDSLIGSKGSCKTKINKKNKAGCLLPRKTPILCATSHKAKV